jgi:hypothetical protein
MKTRIRGQAHVKNAIEIARSPDDVFDYCVDLTREAEFLNGDPMTIELVRFERPVIWETLARSRRLDAKGEGQISATEGGSRLIMRMELSPKGPLRLLLPILGRFLHQQQERNVAAIKQALGGGDATAARLAPEPALAARNAAAHARLRQCFGMTPELARADALNGRLGEEVTPVGGDDQQQTAAGKHSSCDDHSEATRRQDNPVPSMRLVHFGERGRRDPDSCDQEE